MNLNRWFQKAHIYYWMRLNWLVIIDPNLWYKLLSLLCVVNRSYREKHWHVLNTLICQMKQKMWLNRAFSGTELTVQQIIKDLCHTDLPLFKLLYWTMWSWKWTDGGSFLLALLQQTSHLAGERYFGSVSLRLRKQLTELICNTFCV